MFQEESQDIEYKESWKDEYLKWICGFANAHGGKIFIGINDERKVVGIKHSKQLMEDIPNKIVTTLGIVADVNLHHQDNFDYIEICIEPSNIPIAYKGIYHYRSGSTKQELKGVALQHFILKKMGRSWDDIINERATIDDIDPKAIKYFLRKAVDAERMPVESLNDTPEEVLDNLHLIEDGKLKNAAILLFGKEPARFFTCADFRLGRFIQDDTDLIFQDIVEGNIIQMADRVMETLKSKYLISPIHYEGMQRIEPLEIPEKALREAIYNAIIHKDYTGVQIQMKVFNDHIWLWNDGNLPENYTVETLLHKHTSKPRNLNIANAFYKAGFIESWGRGIGIIQAGFKNVGLPAPKLEATMGGVLVIMPRGCQKTNETVNDTATRQVPDKYPTSIRQVPDKYPASSEGSKELLHVIGIHTFSIKEIMALLKLKDRENFMVNYLIPAIKKGYITPLYPNSPHHPKQKYLLTEKGKERLEREDGTHFTK